MKKKKGLERSDHVSVCFFNISLRRHIMRERRGVSERMRQRDRQTEGGERGRILLWQPFHSSWMTFFFFFFLPPVSILSGLQSVNLSRVIWPRHCVNLEYSSGSFFASRGLRLCWVSDGIPQNVTTMCNLVDVDVVWRLVRTWVSSFRWTIKLSLTGWTKTKHLNQLQ